jgi:hypothetical protein
VQPVLRVSYLQKEQQNVRTATPVKFLLQTLRLVRNVFEANFKQQRGKPHVMPVLSESTLTSQDWPLVKVVL